MSPPWPVVLREQDVVLRPLRWREGREWVRLRQVNREWLARWEATSPEREVPGLSWSQMVRRLSAEARAGRMLPFALDVDGRLAGQVTVTGITYGSMRSASLGYWIDHAVAGRGIMPTAVALVSDYCLGAGGLHRLEVNVRPENTASLRVVEKLGFRDEGMRLRYLHIDGDWRDHQTFALTVEEVPGGLLARWRASQLDHTRHTGHTAGPAA